VNAFFSQADPDKTKYTLTIALDLEDWKLLRDQLKETSTRRPSWKFRDIISQMITHAEDTSIKVVDVSD